AGLFQSGTTVTAVDDVGFTIDEGETFGLVGESGSGKTTTGRCMLRLVEPTSGEVKFPGVNVLEFPRARMRQARRDMQVVFQDPYSSLNPRMRARQIVEEPLIIHKIGSRGERRARVAELFDLVGLNAAHLERYPHEFSGGQRQRIGLARALALNPSFLILDEPVSAVGEGTTKARNHEGTRRISCTRRSSCVFGSSSPRRGPSSDATGLRLRRAPHVVLDFPVADVNAAVGELRHVGLVRDEDDRVAG